MLLGVPGAQAMKIRLIDFVLITVLASLSGRTDIFADVGPKRPSSTKTSSQPSVSGAVVKWVLGAVFREALATSDIAHELEFYEEVDRLIPRTGPPNELDYDAYARWLVQDLMRRASRPPSVVTSVFVFSDRYPSDEDQIGFVGSGSEPVEVPPGHIFIACFRLRSKSGGPTASIVATVRMPVGGSVNAAVLVSVVKRFRYERGQWQCVESTCKRME